MPDINNPQQIAGMLGTISPKLGPSFVEQTRGQVAIYGNTTRHQGFVTNNPWLASLIKESNENSEQFYAKVRRMRKHPTVRITRELLIATMAEAPWSVETKDNAPDGVKEYVTDVIIPYHDDLMGQAIRGTFDFGWQAWEKVFNFNVESMHIEIGKLKPLLQDQTEIVVRTDTGAFAGVKQFQTYLTAANTLLVNRNVEGTYYYGEGAMPAIEVAFNRWMVSDDANVRYDNKISGAHWVIHYPPGKTDCNGRVTDNFVLANTMLRALEGSGSIVVPNDLQGMVNDLNSHSQDTAWKIELVTSDASAQVGFQQRLAYLDTLMVRAAGFPERAILEGQYGTKAEAEAHADFAVSNMDYQNKQIVGMFNKFLVNQLLMLNFGPKAKDMAYIKIAPIADDKIAMLKQVYLAALSNPVAGGAEWSQIDMKAVREQVGVPTLPPEQMQGGPDYTGGTGINGVGDPMLEKFLAHLNTPDVQPQVQTGPQLNTQMQQAQGSRA